MADLGRLEPFAMVSFRPGTAVHGVLGQGPLADRKAAVRITLLKQTVLKAVISDLCQADWQLLWPSIPHGLAGLGFDEPHLQPPRIDTPGNRDLKGGLSGILISGA